MVMLYVRFALSLRNVEDLLYFDLDIAQSAPSREACVPNLTKKNASQDAGGQV